MPEHQDVPIVAVHLDRERHFRQTMSTLALVEEHAGVKVLEGIDVGTLSVRQLTVLVWAHLSWEDADLTIDQVAAFLDRPRLRRAVSALAELNRLLDDEGAAGPLGSAGSGLSPASTSD